MKNMVKEIAGHCGGLPLAVVLIGGLLADNKTIDAWDKVRQDLSNSLNKGNDRLWGVQQVLALSYQDLPFHLKACFLYLSLFPEDHNIYADYLVQMWIAEGFVSVPAREGGTKTTFDVGFNYLNELVNRCMVQADISKVTKRVRSIRLHDLMREFCLSKAREEKFSQDIGVQQPSPSTCASGHSPIRRLAVYFQDPRQQEVTSAHKQFQHVRSCLVHKWGVNRSWDAINSFLKGFKFLKVLHLYVVDENIDEQVGQTEEIGKLVHLRYLNLQTCSMVPYSLKNLVLLQTLNLRWVRCDIPDVLWMLKDLRHLYLPERSTSKLHLAGLSKLETLANFHTRLSDVADLATLTNLRTLSIKCHVSDLGNIVKIPMFRESNSLLQDSYFFISGDVETQEEHSHLCQVLACHHVVRFALSGLVCGGISFLQNLNAKITIIWGCL